jgi:putative transposase
MMATRITLVLLARLVDRRAALTIVKPETLIRWHRKGFRLFWRWKSRARGRPALPVDIRQLIAAMARANATWGEERIAAELRLKLGLSVSPGTVRRYIGRSGRPHDRRSSQQWRTFVRNHAGAMLACDFFVTITATFRTLYVLVVLEVGTRRIVHWNVTRSTPRPNGPSSSSAQLFPAIKRNASSFTIATASIPRPWMARSSRWA